MRRLVVLGILFACSRQEAPPITHQAPPAGQATIAQSARDGWIVASPDGVFSVETPVASTPGTNPLSWSAAPSPDLSYLFGYIDLPRAPDQLDDVAGTYTTGLRKTDRIESKTVLGRPARQILGTTPANRAARVLIVADRDRLFMLQVIGTASPADIERFLGSLRIH